MDHYYVRSDGSYYYGDRQSQDDIESSAPVAQRTTLEAQAIQKIRTEFSTRMTPITSGYPDEVQKTFERQLAEAREVQAGSSVPTPFIDAKVLKTGETRATLAARIIANAAAFAQFIGDLDGRRVELEAGVPGLTDADLEGYDAAARW